MLNPTTPLPGTSPAATPAVHPASRTGSPPATPDPHPAAHAAVEAPVEAAATPGPPPRGQPGGPTAPAAEFMAVFERQLSQCRRYGQPLAVLAVGIEQVAALDGAPAEGLATAVAHELWNRLRTRTRAKDTVLRLSELEFGVLLPGCRASAAPGACARLATALGGVYALGPGPVLAVVSLGLANLGADGDAAAALWQAATLARAAGPTAARAATMPARRHEQAAGPSCARR